MKALNKQRSFGWFVQEGDSVEEDAALLEIATDKVDSEIPSPVEGTVLKILFKQNDVVPVGAVIALIGDSASLPTTPPVSGSTVVSDVTTAATSESKEQTKHDFKSSRFYSPLVKSMAKQENISIDELNEIVGTGSEGRVRKDDILNFLNSRGKVEKVVSTANPSAVTPSSHVSSSAPQPKVSVSIGSEDTIIEMDRMRKLIAEHMVNSKNISAHVTAMVEADVTNLAEWREKNKDAFQKRLW